MTDRAKALNEMRRVLKKDHGLLALSTWSTPDRSLPIGIVAKTIRELWPAAVVPGAPMWFDFGAEGVLEKTLSERGFQEVHVTGIPLLVETEGRGRYWEVVRVNKRASPVAAGKT